MKLKKGVANASILGIIVNKLRYKKKLYLIILFEVDKCVKVCFYNAILILGLTIYLRKKSI